MTEILHNPDLPAGEIVEKREDGVWVRNDGVELHPAEKNPFYVMATIMSGGKGQDQSEDRRIWNAWAFDKISLEEKAKIEVSMGFAPDWSSPLSQEDRDLLERRFQQRLGHSRIPDPSSPVDFSNTYFKSPFSAPGFCFRTNLSFKNSFFVSDLYLDTSYFGGPVILDGVVVGRDVMFLESNFEKGLQAKELVTHGNGEFNASSFHALEMTGAVIGQGASFFKAVFRNGGSFESCKIGGRANFIESEFVGRANFDHASFKKWASFRDSKFSKQATFSDGPFEGATDFSGAHFENQVPDFFSRNFHDNTMFTPRPGNWPPVDPKTAKQAKEAYRRLRQVSVAQHNPENEHFFLRQEMACSAVLPENDWLSRSVIKAYGFVSSYGFSIVRPLTGLASTWIGGALAMQFEFARRMVFRVPFEGTDHIPAFGEAIWLGLANTFAIFGFRTFYFGEAYMTALPALVKIVGGTQTVLGFIFLFFLGLGLRNRFRLK